MFFYRSGENKQTAIENRCHSVEILNNLARAIPNVLEGKSLIGLVAEKMGIEKWR